MEYHNAGGSERAFELVNLCSVMDLQDEEVLELFDWVATRLGDSRSLARLLDRPIQVELVDVEFTLDNEQIRISTLDSFHEES